MKLSEMKGILTSSAIRLTKSLGQNFLHDANQLQRIVRAAEVQWEDQILEIGPGLGPLTQLLLELGANVRAIEIDRRLVDILKRRFAGTPKLELIHADALQYVKEHGADDWTPWKLVANLPYSVASPILVELAQAQRRPERMVVTLQMEVAQRIMATAGSADYGLLSLLLQLRYQPLNHFKIPASCFFPAPDVDSACVTLQRRSDELLSREAEAVFDRVIKRAFSQRRKMMFKLLKADWPEVSLRGAFESLKLDPSVRAEKVTLGDFAALTRHLLHAKDHPHDGRDF